MFSFKEHSFNALGFRSLSEMEQKRVCTLRLVSISCSRKFEVKNWLTLCKLSMDLPFSAHTFSKKVNKCNLLAVIDWSPSTTFQLYIFHLFLQSCSEPNCKQKVPIILKVDIHVSICLDCPMKTWVSFPHLSKELANQHKKYKFTSFQNLREISEKIAYHKSNSSILHS